MKTVRTQQDKVDYFLDQTYKYAEKKNKYIYAGHLHQMIKGLNFQIMGSAGYDGYTYQIDDIEGKILLVSDLHYGIAENDPIIKEMVMPKLYDSDYKIVIFLGDTFEMEYYKDTELISKSYFWDWLKQDSRKKIFIRGNHSDSIIDNNNILRKYILSLDPNAVITEEYEIKSMLFIHGDQFDYYRQRFGFLYLFAFRVMDVLNLSKNAVADLIKRFFG